MQVEWKKIFFCHPFKKEFVCKCFIFISLSQLLLTSDKSFYRHLSEVREKKHFWCTSGMKEEFFLSISSIWVRKIILFDMKKNSILFFFPMLKRDKIYLCPSTMTSDFWQIFFSAFVRSLSAKMKCNGTRNERWIYFSISSIWVRKIIFEKRICLHAIHAIYFSSTMTSDFWQIFFFQHLSEVRVQNISDAKKGTQESIF